MNSAEWSEVPRILQGRCNAIAECWYQAIDRTGSAPDSVAEMHQHLVGLTKQAIDLLLAEPLEHGQTEAIGASLAHLCCLDPEALGRTLELLAQQLVQGLSADQVVALQPRLVLLLGGLATGFFQQARQGIFAEQGQIREELISDPQRTEGHIRNGSAEPAVVNEELRREIAEHERNVKALSESEIRLSSMISSMDDIVFAFDSEGRFSFHHSPHAGDLYMPPERFLGRKHSDVMPAHLTVPFSEAFERNRKGEVAQYEYWLEIDDKVRWFSTRLSPMFREGEFAGSVAVAREITQLKQMEKMLREAHTELERQVEMSTAELIAANEQLKREMQERKQTEQALRESEETARALLNAPTDGAALIDTEGIILGANETTAHRFRRRLDELVGACIWDLFPSDMSEHRREYVDEVIQSGTTVRFEDEREGIWHDTVIHPVFDTQGEVTKVAMLARDITKRKQTEEELRRYSERLEFLYEIDQAILASRSAEAIAQTTLDQVRRLVPCIGGAVLLFDSETGDAIVLIAEVNGKIVAQRGTRLLLEEFKDVEGHIESLRQGRVHLLEDTFAVPEPPRVIKAVQTWGMRSLLSIPLVVEDELIGFFSLGGGGPGAFAPEHVDVACEVARPVAIAIQQAQLLEQLSTSRERLRLLAQRTVSTQEEERQRLSRALHDEAGQALIALKISLELIGEDLPIECESLRQRTSDAVALADATMEQIRLLAQDLRPPALDTVGLGPTLEGFCRDFAKRTQLPIDYLGLEMPIVPAAVSICLYRFLQEALTNVAKHACANQVRVALHCDDKTVSLSVKDDGRGFDKAARLTVSGWPMGIGLMGMQERLKPLGGRLEVESRPGQGTRLAAHIPLQEGYHETSTEDSRHHC